MRRSFDEFRGARWTLIMIGLSTAFCACALNPAAADETKQADVANDTNASVEALANAPLPAPASIQANDPWACPYTWVTWEPVPGATSYELWRADGAGSFHGVYRGPLKGVKQILKVGDLAHFKATTCNANGCSQLSTATAEAWGFGSCP